MIFRAMVSAYPTGLPELHQSERIVFIEAINRDDVRKRLPLLAATTWRVPLESVEIYNLDPEFELVASPLAECLPAQQAIFVVGWDSSGPVFVNGQGACGHPIFFLASETDRVWNAYLSLPRTAPIA